MNGRELKTLVWKDLRVNRPILILGIAMFLMAYAAALAMELYYMQRYNPGDIKVDRMLGTGWAISVLLTGVLAAMLGSNVIAGEYADRSAAFLAYLPPSRWAVLTSKAICGITPLVLFLIANMIVPLVLVSLSPRNMFELFHRTIPTLLACQWLIFTGAWSGAAIFRSTAIGTLVGFGLPIVIWVALFNPLAAHSNYDRTTEELIANLFRVISVVLGTVLFGAGSAVFLRTRAT